MRFNLIAAFGLSAVTLAGCVAPVPVAAPAVPSAPATAAPAPTVLDAASRQIARNTVNTEMQRRLPGVNVSPYTDCVVNNATTAELIDIAQASRAGIAGSADSVAAIVSRPATTQCIAAAARTA
ncbi:hypothetical protein D3P06_05235 [Paracoccus aestuarii]|uniref:Succinate dehydrogenase n=1 Tax=Paracoccus aestuarii TaxID=453842 RepID=A0A418ZZG6_9RHOB|nr:hypothetical protein [Paracoccus aestuarii]RJL05953.1 hypothetical protein D3P06_05235 [Paracoccus aestuarii]WCQ98431.1 hypothetical protein JHW48_10950 [Paracoccus aestuarii]